MLLYLLNRYFILFAMGYSCYLTGFSPVNKIGSFPIYIYNVQFYFVKGESVMGIVNNLGHKFSPFL